MVSQVLQFRTSAKLAQDFENNCSLVNKTKTEVLTMLVENFNKDFLVIENFETDLAVIVEIGSKEVNQQSALEEVFPIKVEIKISNNLDNLLKSLQSLDSNPDLADIIKNNLATLIFTLPEFFDDKSVEIYRVDSHYKFRHTGQGSVYSEKAKRTTLSAKMDNGEWKGNVYLYDARFWGANSWQALDDIKNGLLQNVHSAIRQMLTLLVYEGKF